eukprot:1521413-Rhodomonas_salina.3
MEKFGGGAPSNVLPNIQQLHSNIHYLLRNPSQDFNLDMPQGPVSTKASFKTAPVRVLRLPHQLSSPNATGSPTLTLSSCRSIHHHHHHASSLSSLNYRTTCVDSICLPYPALPSPVSPPHSATLVWGFAMQQGVQRVNSESDASIATTAEGTARREKTDSNAVKTESDWTELPGSVAEQRNSTRKLEITVPARSPISTSEEENVFAKHVTMRPTRTKSITVGSGDGCHAESELCPQKYALLRRDFEGSEHSKDEHSRHASAIGWVRPSPQNSAK